MRQCTPCNAASPPSPPGSEAPRVHPCLGCMGAVRPFMRPHDAGTVHATCMHAGGAAVPGQAAGAEPGAEHLVQTVSATYPPMMWQRALGHMLIECIHACGPPDVCCRDPRLETGLPGRRHLHRPDPGPAVAVLRHTAYCMLPVCRLPSAALLVCAIRLGHSELPDMRVGPGPSPSHAGRVGGTSQGPVPIAGSHAVSYSPGGSSWACPAPRRSTAPHCLGAHASSRSPCPCAAR